MSSENMSKRLSRRHRSRKRQPLDELERGSPKKIVIELASKKESASFGENGLFSQAASFIPSSPSPPLDPTPPIHQTFLEPCLSFAPYRSPFYSVGSHRDAAMNTERFNLRPGGDPRAHPTFVSISSEYELASDRELASSQPVSLIQLCAKTGHSRNRANRRARTLNAESTDHIVRTHSVLTHDGVDRHERLSLPPLPNYSNPANYELSDEKRSLLTPPRIISEEYPWQPDGSHTVIARKQPRHLSDHHMQSNPLNYSSHYNNSQTGESGYTSESPFLRKSDHWDFLSCPGHATGPGSITPVARQTPMTQHMECMPASLQLYRDNYDHPHDRSPYESFRLKHRNNRTDLPEITSGLQYGFPADVEHGKPMGNTTIRSEPPLGRHYRGRLSNTEFDTPAREIQNAHISQDSSSSAFGSRLSSSTSMSQRTLKEEIYAILENMNTVSKADSKSMLAQDNAGTERGLHSVYGEEWLVQPLQSAALPFYRPSDNNKKTKQKASEPLGLESENGLGHYDALNPTNTSHMVSGQVNVELHGQADGEPENTSKTSPERTVRLPPGFYETGIPTLFKKGEERLREADRWFHQNSRGEEQLRQYISNVGENFVDRTQRLGGEVFSEQDRVFAKRTISVMGDIIANLHTYKSSDRKKRGQYFADFRPVESHYCEPSCEQRSYFEETCGCAAAEGESNFT